MGALLFQNFLFHILRDKGFNIKFWRTKDGTEVNIIASSGILNIPFKVKYSSLESDCISRSAMSFIKKYKPAYFFIFHTGKRFERKLDQTTVVFIPYYELIFEEIA
ncbi:MAG: hypothetical protein Kow0081_3330 [Candidatus Dojkabacteria bacterium]